MTALYFNHENLALAAQSFFHLYSLFLSVWVCVWSDQSHLGTKARLWKPFSWRWLAYPLRNWHLQSLPASVCVCPGILNTKVLQPCGSHEGFFWLTRFKSKYHKAKQEQKKGQKESDVDYYRLLLKEVIRKPASVTRWHGA